MKMIPIATALLTAATAVLTSSTGQPADPASPPEWIEVVEHQLEDGRVRRPEGQGAMGASVIGFEIKPYRGSLIVEVLERGAVAVFLGWDVDAKDAKKAAGDLRVVFHEQGGKQHETEAAARGGQALLFQSPDDLPIAKLSHFTLVRSSKASWAKKR